MNGIYILIGGNVGNRLQMLHTAKEHIEKEMGHILFHSSLYETAAWGNTKQEAFLNQVLCIDSKFAPEMLLERCLSIEKKMGRERHAKWSPRTIDIDILFYHDVIIEEEHLVIPHPRIQDRRFTLVPLNEIAPNEIHPIFKRSIHHLLQECIDELAVKKLPSK